MSILLLLGVFTRLLARMRLRRGFIARPLMVVARPERLCGIHFESPFYGLTYHGDLGSWIDWNVFFFGAYEQDVLELVRSVGARRESTCLDIGANVGHHALFLSSFFERVYAFEPVPELCMQIEHKRAANSISNLYVVPAALGVQHESATLLIPRGTNLGRGTFHPERLDGAPANALKVQMLHGDSYVRAKGIESVGLVKVDTEGHEASVLAGLHECIERDRPVVLVEVSTGPSDPSPAKRLLDILPNGYLPYRMSRALWMGVIERSLPHLQRINPSNPLPPGESMLLLLPPDWRESGETAPLEPDHMTP